jgi:hypothetical protein
VRPRSSGVTFRKWNRILHRDLGYLVAGLTVIYAVSGVAVNHVRDFNPNFQITHQTVGLGGPVTADAALDLAIDAFGIGEPIRGTFQPDPSTLRVFIEDGTIEVDLGSGTAVLETVTRRPLLGPMNFLHLNTPQRIWTWVADGFAVILGFLAISGLFMVKGRKGLGGRGKWLVAAGVVIPLAFLLLYWGD